MSELIKVDSASLENFKKIFANAGEEYKRNLTQLTNLINEITRGDIQGTLATELKNKFEAKREVFNGLAQVIDDGEEYLGIKGTKFSNMLSDTTGSMK